MFEKAIALNRYAAGDIDKAHECAGSIPVSGTKAVIHLWMANTS
jgi:hypothetical protein